jgi:hypothetical protein
MHFTPFRKEAQRKRGKSRPLGTGPELTPYEDAPLRVEVAPGPQGSSIGAATRDWVRNVIVPALVDIYLEGNRSGPENGLASSCVPLQSSREGHNREPREVKCQ